MSELAVALLLAALVRPPAPVEPPQAYALVSARAPKAQAVSGRSTDAPKASAVVGAESGKAQRPEGAGRGPVGAPAPTPAPRQ